jgi:RNA 2',3'-cyclic 3'-phosphodiesterase
VAKPSANLRLFVAVYPTVEVARQLIETLQNIELPPHRVVPAEQVHITAQFIGDVPAADLDDTIESVRRSAAGLSSFLLKPQRLIALPERGPSRLIAAETDLHPTLAEIHRRLAVRLARNVRTKDAERFRPHLTLCRFRSPAKNVQLPAQLDCPPFLVQQIMLMRSTLSHEGAAHHEVFACDLER